MNVLLLDAYNLIYRAKSGFTKGSFRGIAIMEILIVIVSLVVILAVSYKNVKLNKQVISLYGIINGLKVENNMLENRLDLLEELGNV